MKKKSGLLAPPGIDRHRDPNDAFKTEGETVHAKGKTDHAPGSVVHKAKVAKKAGHRRKRRIGAS